MKHSFTHLTAALLLAFTFNSAMAQNTSVDHYSSAKYDCAIFPATYPSDVDGTPFTPTHDQADQAEKLLESNLKNVKCDSKDDRDEIVKHLAEYKMQIFGYKDALGNQVLLINCFRPDKADKDLSTTWLTDMVQVQNGGIYFWSIKYDIGKNELFEFKLGGSN